MLKIGATELLPPSTDPNDSCNTVEMNAKGQYCFESGKETRFIEVVVDFSKCNEYKK